MPVKKAALFPLEKWGKRLDRRIIITKVDIRKTSYFVTALFEDGRLCEADCMDSRQESLLGNIYIGRIRDIRQKIQAAFVEIAPGQTAYLPLRDIKNPIMVKQARPMQLTQNDEIVVQIVKDAVKTKDPECSTNLNFTGNHVILTSENHKLGISHKLEEPVRAGYRELLKSEMTGAFGLIVRTGAADVSDAVLLDEVRQLKQQYEQLLATCQHRTCYSCLSEHIPSCIQTVRSHSSQNIEKIVTDDPVIFEQLQQYLPPQQQDSLSFYEDASYPLAALYGLSHKLSDALEERVWLKSGAYLVIQPTEALTVIDVNSGKCTKGRSDSFYLRINFEAAVEIARQLRLRNISGICLVDFINLERDEEKEQLVQCFRRELAKDSVPAVFVDFTKLGLAEITRKKIRKPLYEQICP